MTSWRSENSFQVSLHLGLWTWTLVSRLLLLQSIRLDTTAYLDSPIIYHYLVQIPSRWQKNFQMQLRWSFGRTPVSKHETGKFVESNLIHIKLSCHTSPLSNVSNTHNTKQRHKRAAREVSPGAVASLFVLCCCFRPEGCCILKDLHTDEFAVFEPITWFRLKYDEAVLDKTTCFFPNHKLQVVRQQQINTCVIERLCPRPVSRCNYRAELDPQGAELLLCCWCSGYSRS